MDDANLNNKMDFQSYKKLNADERDYFIFDTLCRIDDRTASLDQRFAGKWVEQGVKAFASLTLLGVLGAILATVGIHIKGS